MYKLYFPTTLLGENNIRVYSAIRILSASSPADKVVLSLDAVLYEAYGSVDVSKKRRTTTSETVDALISEGYIDGEKLKGGTYLVSTKYSYERFVAIGYDKYLALKDTALLSFYVYLVGTFDNSLHFGYQAIDTLADGYSMSRRSIISYMNQLEELGIIYVYHSECHGENTNSNIYGNIEDAGEAELYGRNRDNIKAKSKMVERSNWRRGVSIRYAKFVNGKTELSDEEVLLLYNDVRRYNAEMDDLQRLQLGSDYTDKKKSLKVFDEYLEELL